jgi:hypothetical protein
MTDHNNNDIPSYASLVALSARHSLKRARVLYAVNPSSAFIPSTDPTILQASINRRRKRSIISSEEEGNTRSNNSGPSNKTNYDALVIATDNNNHNQHNNNTTLQMKPVVASEALTIPGRTSKTEVTNKTGGILVVRDVQKMLCLSG